MSTTLSGSLNGLDTKDTYERTRLARDYTYRLTASGGGTLRFKIQKYAAGDIGVGADSTKGRWVTVLPRFKTNGGQTCTGAFTIPGFDGDSASVKFIFSRGLGTKGVDYNFFMEPA